MGERLEEINFLVAKYLMANFPDIGAEFVSRCEKNKLFPERVFDKSRAFDSLNTKSLSEIPSDHIIKLIQLSMPSSLNSSLIFNKIQATTIPISDRLMLGNTQPLLNSEINSSSIEICAHFESITQILFDKTQQLLITGSSDSFIKVWHLPELYLVTTLSSHDNNITHVVINPQNTLLFSTGIDKTLCVFSIVDGAFRQRINIRANVLDLNVSPNGTYVAASCDDGTARIWQILPDQNKIDINEKFILHGTNLTTKIPSISFYNDDIVVMTTELSEIILISLSKKKYFSRHCNEEGSVEVKYLPEGEFLCSVPKKKNLMQLTTKSRTFDTVCLPNYKEKLKISNFCYNSDFSFIISISQSKIMIWRRENFSLFSQAVIFENENLTCLIPHPINPMICFVGSSKGNAAVIDMNNYRIINSFTMKSGSKISLARWTENGKHLAFCDELGNLILYGTETDKVNLREQFMGKELNLNSNDSKVFDGNGNVVDPQPPSFKLQNMKLAINVIPQIDEEIDMTDWVDFNNGFANLVCEKTECLRIPAVVSSPQKPEKKYNIFLNQDSSDNEQMSEPEAELTTLPQWTFQTKQEQHFYIPQVGEEIAYFRQGHLIASRLFKGSPLRKPYEYKPSMPKTAFGLIISVRFCITHLILTISFHNMGNLVCDVQFNLPDSVPFIVPLWVYHQSLSFLSQQRVGSILQIPYLEDDGLKNYDAIIEDISPDYKHNPFESITVGFVEGGDQAKVSPWEVHRDNWKAPQSQISTIQEKILPLVSDLMEKFPIYKKARSCDKSEILFIASQLPMDLQLLKDRLENKWYYTKEEMLKDTLLFQQNAGILGIPEEIGIQITQLLRLEISKFMAQNYHA